MSEKTKKRPDKKRAAADALQTAQGELVLAGSILNKGRGLRERLLSATRKLRKAERRYLKLWGPPWVS